MSNSGYFTWKLLLIINFRGDFQQCGFVAHVWCTDTSTYTSYRTILLYCLGSAIDCKIDYNYRRQSTLVLDLWPQDGTVINDTLMITRNWAISWRWLRICCKIWVIIWRKWMEMHYSVKLRAVNSRKIRFIVYHACRKNFNLQVSNYNWYITGEWFMALPLKIIIQLCVAIVQFLEK